MKQSNIEPGTVVLVEWDDIITDPKWQDAVDRERGEPAAVKTVGFFLKNYTYRKKKALRIAHSVTHDGDCDTTNIPYGVIRSITQLKEDK